MLLKNNKAVYVIEGLFLIVILLAAGILLFSGPIHVKKKFVFNSELLLKIAKLNKDISRTKSGVDKIIYYGALKPSQSQKAHLKIALNNLKLSLKRTDKQYKELDGFIKKDGAFLRYDRQITIYFNKSYSKWKNISEPILRIIIKYPKYISSKISYKLFLKHTLFLSRLPVANTINGIKLNFKMTIKIAIYEFIAAVFIIILFVILFFRYFNKFQEILLKNEQKFESMFNNQQSIGFVMDISSGRIIDANNAAIKFYGYSRDELLNMDISQINVYTPAEEREKYRQTAVEKGSNYAVFKHRLKNGVPKTVESRISKFIVGDKPYLLTIINDITEKVENERWMNLLYKGAENSSDWMLITDRLGNIEYVNGGVENITGYKREELIGKNPRIFKSGLLSDEFYKALWDTIISGKMFKGIFINRKKTGELFTLNQTVVPIKNKEDSKITNFVSIAKDITQEKTLEGELRYISLYDPLTKLPNRNLFILTINIYFNSRKYREKRLSAYLIIIDFYKLSYINNTYGYDTGDKLLQSFSKRLNEVIEVGDIVARIGGNEFGILFVDLQNKEDILQIIDRIKEEFKNPLHIGEQSASESETEKSSIAAQKKPCRSRSMFLLPWGYLSFRMTEKMLRIF